MIDSSWTETNVVIKDIRDIDVLFGYCYPSTYRAGMTSLATHLFYSILNSRKDTSCERYFRYDTESPSKSVESKRPLRDNHAIGFSLSFEEDILNVIQMLLDARIPIRSGKRTIEDPIVIVGGPVVSANPCPYERFIDAFVIGEGDLVIHEIIECLRDSTSRDEALNKIAGLKGIYCPSIKQAKVKRLIMDNLDDLFHPTAQIIPNVASGSKLEPVFGKALLVEVGRGCGHSCKFCLVGHICQPRRTRSLQKLKQIITEGINETPTEKIAFIAPTLGDSPGFEELIEWCINQDLEVSSPSLRADSLSKRILELMKQGGQRTLTIAPETGSNRLRKVMGKGLTDESIENAARLAGLADFYSLKLYFIIGLPEENKKDVQQIVDLSKRIANIFQGKITLSVNPFVPKAHTRLQRNAQPPIEIIREKIKLLEKRISRIPRIQIESFDPRSARVQAALSLGGKEMGKIIELAAEYGGLGGWRRAEKETGIPFFVVANNQERLQQRLPWSFISNIR